MKILIETIPHREQRYETIGDWQWEGPEALRIRVSDLGDWRMNLLVARHELDEAMLCKLEGVTQEAVDQYDFTHPEAGGDCFSDDLDAPYSSAHNAALAAEYTLSRLLGVDWKEYDRCVSSLLAPMATAQE